MLTVVLFFLILVTFVVVDSVVLCIGANQRPAAPPQNKKLWKQEVDIYNF